MVTGEFCRPEFVLWLSGIVAMSEVKLQKFGHWVSKLAQGGDRIAFKLLNGQTLTLHKPFHFGSEFVAGSAAAGSIDRVAVRFDAVAAVRSLAAKAAQPE
jgi:hypothetical protein